MKEVYFTETTATEIAGQMLVELSLFRRQRSWMPKPEGMALLVLDMQRYFLEPESHAFIPSAPAIIPHIQALQRAFLARDLQVFHTRHVNTEENAGQMKSWWRELMVAQHPLQSVIEELGDPRVQSIQKKQYDAFFQTELEQTLRAARVQQVVITGVMTHLCCESTARSAFMRGFEVLFVVDGTATYHREFHRATILNLGHGFAVPVLTDDLLARIGRVGEASDV